MKNISIIILVFVLYSCTEKGHDSVPELLLETPVESALIVENDVTRIHRVPAIFMAVNRADLSFQLSGTVDRVLVQIGQAVEKGQALMSVYNLSLIHI